MSRRPPPLFGTDGIRGPAGEGLLTAESVVVLGRCLASALGTRVPRRAPRVLLGRDTRPSGTMVGSALLAGLQQGGAVVEAGGVLPTPAVALLVREKGFDCGLAVSASHNPAADNGLKVLGADGEKAPKDLERDVERLYAKTLGKRPVDAMPGSGLMRPRAAWEYVDFVVHEFRRVSLDGLRVVVDAAEGAASWTAPEILRRLGARVVAVHADARGDRINHRCGAMHPASAGRAVKKHGAQVGIALDGDADRLVLLDHRGRPHDGDDFLAAVAPRLRRRGRLPGHAVVGTVMANGGLDAHLHNHGIELVRTPVGDRHVAEALRTGGLALGAEPSGHILVPRDGLLTSDGVVSALWVLREMARDKVALEDLLAGFVRVPRAETAVRIARRTPLERIPAVRKALATARERVGPRGRILARFSGTEPKVRLLAESPRAAAARAACAGLAAAVEAALGPKPKKG